jgi:two-component system nitrogen regulation sensor histidine kinase NtrY
MQIIINRFIQALLKGRWLFVLMLAFLALSLWFESNSGTRFYNQNDTSRFQLILQSKQSQTDSLLTKVLNDARGLTENDFVASLSHEFANLSKKGIGIFVYRNDSLIFWSDNNIPVPSLRVDFPVRDLVGIANSYFIKREKNAGHLDAIGLILIKKEYPYENRFLKNSFQEDFNLDPEVIIQPKRSENRQNAVYNSDGNFLFTLDYNITRKLNPLEKQLSVFMYVFVFILFLLFLRRFIHNAGDRLKNIMFLLSVGLLFGVYYFLHYFRLPEIIFNLELFSPGKYARSEWFPSLGDLLLLAVICFFTVYNFYKEFMMDLSLVKKTGMLRYLLMLLFSILIIGWFVLTVFLFESLILDSTISFETYKVLNLTVYTFFGFLILALLFTTLALLIDKIMGILKNIQKNREGLYLIMGLNIFVFLSLLTTYRIVNLESAFFFLILSLMIYFMRITRRGDYRFSGFVSFVLLFSVFTVAGVFKYTGWKSQTDMKIKAVNLSAEHDPIAELLFVDIDTRLKNDEELKSLIFAPHLDVDLIYSRLQRKYFSGFWDKYEFQITLCRPRDSLYVAPPEDNWYHCYDYFNELILKNGIEVPNTGFYFLDNLNGRISYFGTILFRQNNSEQKLFIELNSRLISEGLGYPELLLDDKYNPPPSAGDYSYAKYSKGRLITFSGSFAYYLSSSIYTDGSPGWSYSKKDKYDHLIYNIDNSNTIIVSKASVFWVDIIISFSYIFSFYFIIMVFFLLITNISPVSTRLQWNFKNKIQFAITGLLFFSLLCIGAGVVYFSIRQYQSKHVEILQEKIQSVYVELIHKLEFEKDLHNWSTSEYYSIDDMLEKFSNVFYTDINLYDDKGELLATSRPEIIENNLIAGRMNTQAYLEMVINRRSEYIHNENIGGLEYLSAYVPFVNSENKLLAYLNLPYFTRQDELTSEITNLVVAIINIMVLMSLLSFTIAVFLSNKLTLPLRLLQESFARISLNSKNEKINYTARNEIGSLVSEYNKMVDQLTFSAELLAKSERESAWREMAKQIAHEIKNPLTPMRLSIQHLQRSILDKKEDWDEQFARLSKMLIEQIDDLSDIATEFSTFAKMPSTHNEKLDLVAKLNDTCRLFENTGNLSISLDVQGITQLYVNADREQLSRVFINLMKNAIQSLQDNKEGKLHVSLEKKGEIAIISFRDNGKGIPEEIRDRLFQPNFTTKTGGMGMGLAIVESILKNAGGKVYYETELNKGSVFIVELPIYSK